MRAEALAPTAPVRVVVVTLDNHLAGAAERAQAKLAKTNPGLTIDFHAASDWDADAGALAKCHADIARGDVIISGMLFMEEHVSKVLPQLTARREACDAMVGAMSAAEVVKLTKLGPYRMDAPAKGPMALLKKLRGAPKKPGQSSGAGQMALLKKLPKMLKFIPGTAQDVRAYFLTLQYWLSGSDENFESMVRNLVDRYATGERAAWKGNLKAAPVVEYPELGLYHPSLPGRMTEIPAALPKTGTNGTVGLLLLRSYVLANDAAHYDGVIAAFEARGLNVVPAFATTLDSRPAIEKFFMKNGKPTIDAMVSLTGFSLVGGPAYNDSAAAEEILATMDRPYLAAHPLEFQTLQAWGASARGLMPIEATMMVAIPELDGAVAPAMFGGRADASGEACIGCGYRCTFAAGANAATTTRAMQPCRERAEALAAKTARLIVLAKSERAERRIGLVIFNFPPNAGAVGSAAYLSVFQSVHATLGELKREGYTVDLPATIDELRDALLIGNSARYGADANVLARIPTDDHVRREPHLAQIEGQWGPAPGRQQSDGSSIHVLGVQFGNVAVTVQPAFGYEGDPMRLLFEGGFSPTHAFSAFYRWLREDFHAHALLHFGTHGALEFMPGKQTGLSANDWPERLIGDVPNFYIYAANNPSEGTIAKRRANATLISYLTPPIAHAGLYKGLLDLKSSLDRWRSGDSDRSELGAMIQEQATALDLAKPGPAWADAEAEVAALNVRLYEFEETLIPSGLHVIGQGTRPEARADLLLEIATGRGLAPTRASVEALVNGSNPKVAQLQSGLPVEEATPLFADLATANTHLTHDTELAAIVRALDARYIRPAVGGDVLRTPAILPTGRNLHGFDPYRIPSNFAVSDGALQAQRIIDRHMADGAPYPKSIAMVLWGCDNMKSEGGQIAQAMALMGARPRFDNYGRLCGAELIPLASLARPRIDVISTLSGIFRDLLPLQTRMLAEAAFLAAQADEPAEMNPIRAHALAFQEANGGSLETAALRVFSNAEGTYGANVNQLIDAGCWETGDELADAYQKRKGFAYGMDGRPVSSPKLLDSVLSHVDLAYQNLDSVELGVTTIDQYVDTLGGIAKAVKRAKGGTAAPVYIGDQTQGTGKVRTLSEQVSLETRTRMLNPRWYEGMLEHGFEGVRQIEVHVTNTMGWSATADAVDPWVYQRITETYVLDDAMRTRLAELNPKASARVANRLIEASERKYWTPDAATLAALYAASDEIEDRLEGIAA